MFGNRAPYAHRGHRLPRGIPASPPSALWLWLVRMAGFSAGPGDSLIAANLTS